MRKLLLASVAWTALAAAPATAADMGRPTLPPPVFFSWTGCYFGAHLGGVWVSKEWFDRDPFSSSFGQSDGSHDPRGLLGGIQVGCDYQFAGGFVIGIAGDYAWTDADASNISLLFPGQTNHSSVKSLASVTGRVGYAFDRFLGYVKGGVAWERDDYVWDIPLDCECTGTASQIRSGWTIGIGGEYAFTNFLSGFVEYNYYDFGNRDLLFVDNFGGTFIYGIDETKSVVKAGLNLRLGGVVGGPGMARY